MRIWIEEAEDEGLRAGGKGGGQRGGEGWGASVLVGEAEPTMALSEALFERGVFVHGIRPPTVPKGECRLRLVPMATHSDSDIAEALSAFAEARR